LPSHSQTVFELNFGLTWFGLLTDEFPVCKIK
jgi:hypothetical protein